MIESRRLYNQNLLMICIYRSNPRSQLARLPQHQNINTCNTVTTHLEMFRVGKEGSTTAMLIF